MAHAGVSHRNLKSENMSFESSGSSSVKKMKKEGKDLERGWCLGGRDNQLDFIEEDREKV